MELPVSSTKPTEPTVLMDGHVRPLSNWLHKMNNISYWDYYISQTYSNALTSSHLPLDNNQKEKAIVIVEPRNHIHLHYVIFNVLHFLDKGWKLYIYHGTKNIHLVEHIIKNIKGDKPTLINMGVDNLTIPDYNKLLTSIPFWEKIDAENILIFQTDSLLLQKGIEQFVGYDYVGAPWKEESRPKGLLFGNGGISMRRKSTMIKICKEQVRKEDEPEDVYFSYWCSRKEYNCKLPSLEGAYKFSTESMFKTDSICIHPDMYSLSQMDLHKLLGLIRYGDVDYK